MASLFGTVDFIIFGIVVLLSLATGVYHACTGGKQKTPAEFISGNRQMSALPVGLSLMASFESAIMMLGIPAETYFYSAQWIISVFGYVIGRCIASVTVIPFIFRMRLTSSFKYLEMRFKSRFIKQLGSFFSIISYLLYMGIALFAPALAMEAVLGFPYWISMVTVAAAAIIYTCCGGIKAVVWTDAFQASIMYIGMLAFAIKGTIDAGGFSYVWEVNKQHGRLDIFKFDVDPTVRHTFWGLLIGDIIIGILHTFSQASVQRLSSIPNVKVAKRSIYIASVAFIIILTLAIYEGLVIFAYYSNLRCDPLKSNKIKNPNQVLPYMVVDIFGGITGLPGLFLASIVCASLSTISTCLTTCSSLAWDDFIRPSVGKVSDFKGTVYNRIAVIVCGLVGFGLSFVLMNVKGSLSQITRLITASIHGSFEALFIVGALCPWVNKYGAGAGFLTSAGLLSWVTLGQLLSSGVRQTPFLPPAPTDKCFTNSTQGDEFFTYSDTYWENQTQHYLSTFDTTTSSVPIAGFPVSGINALYSLSYKWIAPVCVIILFIVATLVSLLVGRTKPGDVDRSLIYPILGSKTCSESDCAKRCLPCYVPYYMTPHKMVDGEEGKQLYDVAEMEILKKIEIKNGSTLD